MKHLRLLSELQIDHIAELNMWHPDSWTLSWGKLISPTFVYLLPLCKKIFCFGRLICWVMSFTCCGHGTLLSWLPHLPSSPGCHCLGTCLLPSWSTWGLAQFLWNLTQSKMAGPSRARKKRPTGTSFWACCGAQFGNHWPHALGRHFV